MSSILPDREDLRRAIKWVSSQLQEDPEQPLNPLVQQAIFKYDLSPLDGEFMINFYLQSRSKVDKPA